MPDAPDPNTCENNAGYWVTVDGQNSLAQTVVVNGTNDPGEAQALQDLESLDAEFGANGNSGGNGGGGFFQHVGALFQTPSWYKNSCVTNAVAKGALSVGIDSIGLIPEAGGVARVIGHQAGYVGAVADQVGFKVVNAVGKSTSTVQGLSGLIDTSSEGLLSTGLTIAGFIPGFGQVAAGASIVLDIYKTAEAIGKCN